MRHPFFMLYTNGGTTGTYCFHKNHSDDVAEILDNSGNIVVKYAYDAFDISCKKTEVDGKTPDEWVKYWINSLLN